MKKKLKYYGGQGLCYSPNIGKFQVKTTKVKEFDKLREAVDYYNSLHEEKALWDVTTIPELLECHCYF